MISKTRKHQTRKTAALARQGRRGIALLIVLMVTAILTVLVLDFAQSTRINFYIASNIQNGMRAYYMAKSGVQVAQGALLRDIQKNKEDHEDEDWNNPLFSYIPLSDTETISINITDEAGKFDLNRMVSSAGNVNRFRADTFARLLELLELDPAIRNAVLDWLDTDLEVYDGAGIEDQVYGYSAATQEGYSGKNGRLSSLAEIKLIKGVNDDVFRKLAEVCTIYSSGKMNVNTIHEKVLTALILNIDEKAPAQEMATKIIAYREVEDQHFVKRNLRGQLIEAGVDPRVARRLRGKLGVSSNYFSVDATANVGATVKSIHAVIKRSKKKTSLVYFRPGELLSPPKPPEDLAGLADMISAARESGLSLGDLQP